MPKQSQTGHGIPVLLQTLCNAPSCNRSLIVPPLPSKELKNVNPISDGKSIFIFGGVANQKTYSGSSETFQLNLASGEWTQKRSMGSKRYAHFVVELNEEEFWIGGSVWNAILLIALALMDFVLTG